MKKGLRRIIIILIVIAAAAGLGSLAYTRFGQQSKGKNTEEKMDLAVPVAITRVKAGNITESLRVTGSVQAIKEVSIYSTVPGKAKKILVSEGDRVQKDQVLAYIERDEAGLDFADAAIESTIRGIVKKILTEEGASITPTMPLFLIVDMDSVEVIVNIPEKHIPEVIPGLKVEVSVVAYPDKIFAGTIYKLSPVVDPVSRTREARVLLLNKDHILKPGMFGSAEIIIRRLKQILLIPYSAIIDRNDERIVYIVEEGTAREIMPEIEIVKGEIAAVKSGLKEGDEVIVIGQHNLSGGDKVTIAEEIE